MRIRRNHEHLTTIDESCTLPADQQCCSCCGEPLEEIRGTNDGDILEIEVQAHRRRYHRQRYRRTCTCPQQPAIITAPPPDKLIPKSNLGISIWTMILQHKFEFYQPLHRVLAELRSHDLNLVASTITGGLKKIKPLFIVIVTVLPKAVELAELIRQLSVYVPGVVGAVNLHRETAVAGRTHRA